MNEAIPGASHRRICRVLEVARSALTSRSAKQRTTVIDEVLAERIHQLIRRYPTFGYRRIWAMLRRSGVVVNLKAVYRVMRIKGWFVQQRRVTPRPRVRANRSRTEKSNVRWAMDMTHIHCKHSVYRCGAAGHTRIGVLRDEGWEGSGGVRTAVRRRAGAR